MIKSSNIEQVLARLFLDFSLSFQRRASIPISLNKRLSCYLSI
jgi:hypothetical protein